ncbi:MAG: hypothetical protein E7A72_08060 [Actinomyces urogenitalis]|uniref:DUF6941 family protein n=1 Tax=Actinomyces urogenitalis TaxID=103621 RepID=UPI002431185F|nr:hypothetical protein [Actinomyces urogenitalis]MBS5975988.1 hypothetical protein [Actinomyces urogenitalis]MDU0972831.1 hypothetical protein [Actinomyces urogenitalis]MDU6151192.1 hypothetical protein [Actinomyces urogenitalis]
MIDLDYAMLADYAAIQDSKLTVVGASFTRVLVDQVPMQAFLAVAGRARCDEPDRQDIGLTVRVISPGEEPLVIEATNRLDASEEVHPPYLGHKRGIIFAVQIAIPLLTTGTYTVEVDIDETEGVDRTLKFEAACLDQAQDSER